MRGYLIAVLLTAGPASADVFGFETPSGNVQCAVVMSRLTAEVSCTIHQRYGPPARIRPSDCQGYWGYEFYLRDRGPAELICGSWPRRVQTLEVADYGITAAFHDITCLSEEAGLQCINSAGHGFFLSRDRQFAF